MGEGWVGWVWGVGEGGVGGRGGRINSISTPPSYWLKQVSGCTTKGAVHMTFTNVAKVSRKPGEKIFLLASYPIVNV